MSILDYTATELAEKIKNKEVTVLEAAKAVLEQIDKKEDIYHCYITIDKEKVLKQAEDVQAKIDSGELDGPLAGVPVAIRIICVQRICLQHVHQRFLIILFQHFRQRRWKN